MIFQFNGFDFDWLYIIEQLRDEGLTQEKIGEKIGWSREVVAYHCKILDVIVTQVLDLCKQHQIGRVTKKVTDVTFDFSENWFRQSGLYKLKEEYQLDCIKRFIADMVGTNKSHKEKQKFKSSGQEKN